MPYDNGGEIVGSMVGHRYSERQPAGCRLEYIAADNGFNNRLGQILTELDERSPTVISHRVEHNQGNVGAGAPALHIPGRSE
jgi:hypothetical protein